jgi:plastocyanin
MRVAVVLGLATAGAAWLAADAAPRARADAGSVAGRVTFDGSPPPPVIVIQDGGSQKVLHVDRSGGLRHAVVFLTDAPEADGPPATAATMGQRNFMFEPQVLAVRAGQPVRFTNDDPANHNVRVEDADPRNTFSISTASGSVGPHVHSFAPVRADRPLQLSCDIHPWMAAWIYVFDHDLFAVTDPGGTFRIHDVPPGRHRLAVRQPSGRLARDLTVDVRAGQASEVHVRFTPTDLGVPPR